MLELCVGHDASTLPINVEPLSSKENILVGGDCALWNQGPLSDQ